MNESPTAQPRMRAPRRDPTGTGSERRRRHVWQVGVLLSAAVLSIGEWWAGARPLVVVALAVAAALSVPISQRLLSATAERRVTVGFAAAVLLVCVTASVPPSAAGLAALTVVTMLVIVGRRAAVGYAVCAVAALATTTIVSSAAGPAPTVVAEVWSVVLLPLIVLVITASTPGHQSAAARSEDPWVRQLSLAAERARCALEMQEFLGRHLIAATMVTRTLHRDLRSDSGVGALASSDEVERLLRSALAETRRVARVLEPVPPRTQGTVGEALADLVEAVVAVGVRVNLSVPGGTTDADAEVCGAVRQVAQGFLIGAARRAGGSVRVTAVLEADGDSITLLLAQDRQAGEGGEDAPGGTGLDEAELSMLQSLAEPVGGRVRERRDGDRAVLELWVPRCLASSPPDAR